MEAIHSLAWFMVKNYYKILIILTLNIKMEAIQKRVIFAFFHEKWETLKSTKWPFLICTLFGNKNSATIFDFKIVTITSRNKQLININWHWQTMFPFLETQRCTDYLHENDVITK